MEDKKKWFGRGIYGSKDVPIRLLDGLIFGIVAVILILVFWFTLHGGYTVRFETDGGSEVASQKLKHGELVKEPDLPLKPGYTFAGWMTNADPYLAEDWEFAYDKIQGDVTLYARWEPAEITVKFDLDGGLVDGEASVPDLQAVYGEAYGELPLPSKEGFRFDGWIYSGVVITSETEVTMTGEHVLTARWI